MMNIVMKQRMFFILSVFLLFAAASCSKGSKIDIAVDARSAPDGKPVYQAKVIVDGKEEGVTDSSGKFTGQIIRKPGAEVELLVKKDTKGYRYEPWKKNFIIRLPKDSAAADKYEFIAEMTGGKYFTVAAKEKDAMLSSAQIVIDKKKAGATNEKANYCINSFNSRVFPCADAVCPVRKPCH